MPNLIHTFNQTTSLMTHIKTSLIAIAALSLLLTACINAFAETGKGITKEDRIKGLVIFSMTKYVLWPEGGNELVMGILSNDQQIAGLFNEIAEHRSTSSKKIIIKSYSSVEAAIAEADLLYIPNENSEAFIHLAEKNIKNVLVVTEKEGLGKQGSAINLVTIDGKLRFEINKKAVERAGLKISTKLTEMGIEI